MTTTSTRVHVWRPGNGGDTPPLLLLHGTGGDEHDLLGLHEHLAPSSAVLSVRGTVLENGMPRFFRRIREGVFDEDDLCARTDELAEFLTAAEAEYGIEPGSEIAVGFSNGANIASALLFRRPESLAGAVLFAGMVPFRQGPPTADLAGKRVAIVNGSHDPMATAEHTDTLGTQLRTAGAEVLIIGHGGGHQIDPDTLPRVAEFLRETR